MTKQFEDLLLAMTRWLNADAALKEKAANNEEAPQKIIALQNEELPPETLAGEPTGESTETPVTPAKRSTTLQEFAASTGIPYHSLFELHAAGKLPTYKVDHKLWIDVDKFHVEPVETVDDLRKNFEFYQGYYRGAADDSKSRAIALKRIHDVADQLPVEFTLGATPSAIRTRFDRYVVSNVVHTYQLGHIAFINLDELRRFALWWVENFRRRNKSELAGHEPDHPEFCLHENDFLWARTRNYLDREHPDQDALKQQAKEYSNYFVIVRGIRYYKPEVLSMI